MFPRSIGAGRSEAIPEAAACDAERSRRQAQQGTRGGRKVQTPARQSQGADSGMSR